MNVCRQFAGPSMVGGRYPNWQADRRVGRRIVDLAKAKCLAPQVNGRTVVLAGGAIESNGQGTILTTEQCLLGDGQRARASGLSRADLERTFSSSLGADHVLWLDRGIAGDDTHGHIDTLARFVGPNRVLTIVEADPRDENYAALQDNLHRLRTMHDERGRPLEIVELPMPGPLRFAGSRLPASYANFYLANGVVVVPTFNDPHDVVALRILGECFPEREVRGVHCVDVALGLGTLHCLTQQQPCGPTAPLGR